MSMGDLLEYLPIAAAGFAIPQFLPQLFKLRATDDCASWNAPERSAATAPSSIRPRSASASRSWSR